MPAKTRLKPRKLPKQERAQRTVDAILEAAAQVFDRAGYAKATTDRIAARAGVSIGSLYQYFPSKDAILVALAERHAAAGAAQVSEALEGEMGDRLAQVPLAQLLRSFIEQLVALHQEQPRLHRLLFSESPIAEGQHARFMGLEEQLAAQIAPLLDRHPEVRVADADLAAWMVVHVSHGLIHDFVIHPPPEPFGRDDFVRHLVGLLEGYLGASPNRASWENGS